MTRQSPDSENGNVTVTAKWNWRDLFSMTLTAAIAGGGTSYGIMHSVPDTVVYELNELKTNPQSRPDAFTRQDGLRLEKVDVEMTARLTALEFFSRSFPVGFQQDAAEQMRVNTAAINRLEYKLAQEIAWEQRQIDQLREDLRELQKECKAFMHKHNGGR